MNRMKTEARPYLWWSSLDKDIEDLTRQYQSCTENAKQPVKAPLRQRNI
ncbi:unnamed protein product, partial [Rotaria sordida]